MGSSSPTSQVKQVHPRADFMGLHPDSSVISPVRETLQPLWAICFSPQSPAQKEALSHVHVELPVPQFLPGASFPVGWHY